jgi:hypothetical protein
LGADASLGEGSSAVEPDDPSISEIRPPWNMNRSSIGNHTIPDRNGAPRAAGDCGAMTRMPGLRIYLTKDGLKIIILIGDGIKKRQQHDIDQAVALWEDYKRRKASTRQGK